MADEPEAERGPEPDTLVIEDDALASGFVMLPRRVLLAHNLSRDAKLLYAVLLHYAWQAGRCFPGYDRLCGDMGASENAVRKYMRELEAVGLLRQKRRGQGRTNLYTLPAVRRAVLRTAESAGQEPQPVAPLEPAQTEGEIESDDRGTGTFDVPASLAERLAAGSDPRSVRPRPRRA